MKIAIDLDNTIFNYNDLFSKAAKREGFSDFDHCSKEEIREIIKKSSSTYEWPSDWIKIQGRCYGDLIHDVEVDDFFFTFLLKAQLLKYEIEIVSHKTEVSLCGNYSLRKIANEKLKSLNLSKLPITFLSTAREKVEYINNNKFDIVIDDLAEILSHVKGCHLKIHFSEQRSGELFFLKSWKSVLDFLVFLNMVYGHKEFLYNSKRTSIIKAEEESYFIKINSSDRIRREVKALDSLGHIILCRSENFFITRLKEFKEVHFFDLWFIEQFQILYKSFQKNKSFQGIFATNAVRNSTDYTSNVETRLNKLRLSLDLDTTEKIELLLAKILKDLVYEKGDFPLSFTFPDFFRKNFGKRNGELIIFDYESVGYDDLARTFLNSVHHFGNNLELNELKNLVTLFDNIKGDDSFFWNRVLKYYDIVALEWILIGYGNFNNIFSSKKLNKMIKNHQIESSYLSWNQKAVELIHEFV